MWAALVEVRKRSRRVLGGTGSAEAGGWCVHDDGDADEADGRAEGGRSIPISVHGLHDARAVHEVAAHRPGHPSRSRQIWVGGSPARSRSPSSGKSTPMRVPWGVVTRT